ncbi:hypothetical protein [Variovorax ginsengisoli]|uniref:Uncharacterized protein n=1 Tax=Variovorax ginsengisoli TaxID=363844 RepID=A0ABT8SFE6_9BURK|nr:hypothetical protein [Variovorax ginsengisoli]MDN8617894.1 hypothetical protein [Variovorax ginsengisoli]MDO1537064.1 hypothetical protein [Variovorax ginsengisoli]
MRRLLFSLLFLAGGVAHEWRNPVNCQCISARQVIGAERGRRRRGALSDRS